MSKTKESMVNETRKEIKTLTGAEIFIECLKKEGVDEIF